MKLIGCSILYCVITCARAFPTIGSSSRPLHRDVTVTSQLVDNFKLFANYTAAAYCPGNELSTSTSDSLISCSASVCPLVEAENAYSVVEFGTNDTSLTDVKGFVAVDPTKSLIVVVFAGSGQTIRNWITDFVFIQVAYSLCPSCLIHVGFATAWDERRSSVLEAVSTAVAAHPNFSIMVTGHSIGAAVATLAAAELRSLNYTVDTYTYGSPRVGNAAFATFVTDQAPLLGQNYRITHYNDPIPQIPPTWVDYEHTSPEYWLKSGNDTRNDYGAQDIIVCEGVGNDDCNAGVGLIPIDGTSHNHYFGEIDACAGSVAWKRDRSN